MKRSRFGLLPAAVLLIALLAGGCDTYEPAGVGRQYVVEAYLEAGRILPPVRLSRTAPIDETYDFTALAVSDAEVRIEHLSEDGQVAQTFDYAEDPDQPGVYRPQNASSFLQRSMRARPLERYRLEIAPPASDDLGTEPITAETVVPDTFRVARTSGDTLVFSEDALQATVTPSRYPGRDARFVVTTSSFDASPESLTPFAFETLDYSGGEIELEDLTVTESPIFNESNYEVGPGGTLTIDLPWLVVNFFGSNEIAFRAIDDNYYDFLRSQDVQQGIPTFSPGEIPNVIERVSGGTGLFGSYAVARYNVEVERPDDLEDVDFDEGGFGSF